jgi:hypothetical protein
MAPSTGTPRVVLALTWLGLVPFLVSTTALFTRGPLGAFATLSLLAYAAAILSFLGGVHWGLAMRQDPPAASRLAIAALPALVGWAALLIEGGWGMLMLAAAFLLVLAQDWRLAGQGEAPPWYPKLRWPVTLIVVACLLVGWSRL